MGTGPCSDPLWVACVCSVPGVTSIEMPEPGKKPGSSRSGVGLSVGHGGLGASTIGGGRTGVKFLRGDCPPGSFSGSQFLLPILLMRVRVNQGLAHRGEGAKAGGSWGHPLTLRRQKDPSLPQPLSSAARLGLACLLGKGRCRQAPRLTECSWTSPTPRWGSVSPSIQGGVGLVPSSSESLCFMSLPACGPHTRRGPTLR